MSVVVMHLIALSTSRRPILSRLPRLAGAGRNGTIRSRSSCVRSVGWCCCSKATCRARYSLAHTQPIWKAVQPKLSCPRILKQALCVATLRRRCSDLVKYISRVPVRLTGTRVLATATTLTMACQAARLQLSFLADAQSIKDPAFTIILSRTMV